MHPDITATIRAYYDALRSGEPLAPYFTDRDDIVKFGVSERLEGYEAIAAGLRDQTRTTTDWVVESNRLCTTRRGDIGWFSDTVTLEWTNTSSGERHAFETRWSGTLERDEGAWRFVGMHVSAPHDL